MFAFYSLIYMIIQFELTVLFLILQTYICRLRFGTFSLNFICMATTTLSLILTNSLVSILFISSAIIIRVQEITTIQTCIYRGHSGCVCLTITFSYDITSDKFRIELVCYCILYVIFFICILIIPFKYPLPSEYGFLFHKNDLKSN